MSRCISVSRSPCSFCGLQTRVLWICRPCNLFECRIVKWFLSYLVPCVSLLVKYALLMSYTFRISVIFLIYNIQWLHVARRKILAIVPLPEDRPLWAFIGFSSSYLKESSKFNTSPLAWHANASFRPDSVWLCPCVLKEFKDEAISDQIFKVIKTRDQHHIITSRCGVT